MRGDSINETAQKEWFWAAIIFIQGRAKGVSDHELPLENRALCGNCLKALDKKSTRKFLMDDFLRKTGHSDANWPFSLFLIENEVFISPKSFDFILKTSLSN